MASRLARRKSVGNLSSWVSDMAEFANHTYHEDDEEDDSFIGRSHAKESSSLVKNIPQGNALGTFDGVFVPCVLNIFGVILFERLAWAVAQAGNNN